MNVRHHIWCQCRPRVYLWFAEALLVDSAAFLRQEGLISPKTAPELATIFNRFIKHGESEGGAEEREGRN